MAELLKPDICVIGAGAGGLSLAAATAALGVSVVLVERGRMGGDCLYTGCVPSKSLIAAGKHARAIAVADAFGIAAQMSPVDLAKVREHVRGVIAAIAPNDSKARFTGLGVRVIEGSASFKNRRTVVVGDDIAIRARRFVIATGSKPFVPPIPGLDAVPYLTNESVFELGALPEHLVVVGAGPQGLELAQAFHRLGSAVTVIEAAKPLAREDPECAQPVLDALVEEGVDLRIGVAVERVEAEAAAAGGAGIKVVLGDAGGEPPIVASHLLLAVGRRVDVEGLGLDRAGIRQDRSGIRVNRRLRTANRRVYAIGDAAGGPQFTHVANYHAGLVIRNVLFRLRVKVDTNAIPRVTFTDPELAHVGLSEDEARARGIELRVLRWPYHENDRAQSERATAGHIKIITDRGGRIVGCTIVGAGAGELITAWSLAISEKLNIRALAGIMVPYPTLAEIGKRAAMTYLTAGLTKAWVRRIIDLLRRFI
jgi:pyruvate/2-oxoglutarate dehydrogenase complex dihydrolipoamide dehydrogenase (E3) component